MADWRAPPPTRGQQNLLGFMQMSSGRRFSLEQLMVESGRLEPEQTLNHRAWGPLSVLSASRKDVLAAQIGEFEDLTTYEMGMLLNQRLLASANFTDFVTVDDGASAHDAHLDAALADFDDEFTSLQLETGQLDPVSSGAAAAAVAAGGVAAAAAAAAAPAPLDHF